MNHKMLPEDYLHAAASGDMVAVSKYVSEHSADAKSINVKNANGETALMLAANNNHINIVLALLAVPQIEVDTRVMFLALFRNLNTPQAKNVVAVPSKISFEEFMNAAKNDNLNVVQQYIKENGNDYDAINKAGQEDFTALGVAVKFCHYSCVDALLKAPAIDVFLGGINKKADGKESRFSPFGLRGIAATEKPYYDEIQQALYDVAIQALSKMKSNKMAPYVLEVTSWYKQKIFDAIMRIEDKVARLEIFKRILTDEDFALRVIFMRGKQTFNKGLMAKVIEECKKLCNELNQPMVNINAGKLKEETLIGGWMKKFTRTAENKPFENIEGPDSDNENESSIDSTL